MTLPSPGPGCHSFIDWKDPLGLELTAPGFDFSVLCEFRAELLAGFALERLLEKLLVLVPWGFSSNALEGRWMN